MDALGSRRRYLAVAGSVVGSLTAGCAGPFSDSAQVRPTPRATTPATRQTRRPEGRTDSERPTPTKFETIVDMVADAGCDPTGERPCDAALKAAVGDGVLLAFPPGTYRFEEEHRFVGVNDLGIVGSGRDHRDVEFVFPSGYSGIFLGLWEGENWLLENVTVQQSMDRRTGVGLEIVARDGLRVRDVEIAGFSPYNERGGQRGLYCDIRRADGVGVIERYRHSDPSAVGDYPNGTQAFLADEGHRGTLYCRDWHIENAGENGIYASRTPGNVRVEGGFFRNNDVSSIRVCGDGSYIRGATIVIDTADAHPANAGRYGNTRGIWWESGPLGKTGGHIEDCELVMRSTPESQGLLRIERTAGTVAVRNCRLRNETSWATLVAVEPTRAVSPGGGIQLEQLSIEAIGGGQPPVDISGRPRTALSGVTVSSPHESRDGLRFANAPGMVVRDAVVHAGRFPLRIKSAEPSDACLARVTARLNLSSARFDGPLLIRTAAQLAADGGRPFYCVPTDYGVPYDAVALTSTSEAGFHGYLLGADGGILPGQGQPVTAPP